MTAFFIRLDTLKFEIVSTSQLTSPSVPAMLFTRHQERVAGSTTRCDNVARSMEYVYGT
eukprot:CAMPEP_0197713682 /NCGR_PEP_ID=MMETSP1338-20131121/130582_1 /TAXON_ID=43686 ORGANISM="Pelagodinium beii, Strain RCC1491" /NCGR_SAMPLE_ID=MMETSP1338 /ASSEMBLY_ACC=CAM_ASM_000754 /LENGTH=58 /DNA_ID=CAMNT_0043297623 /DNA_START=211 /DNA_END=387 /DNA_ORIENTATION=-